MPTESLVAALQGTDYDTGLDLKKLNVVREHFAKLREKYLASGQLSPKMLGVDANTLLYQVPGGMLSNLLKQLKDAGKEDQLDAVLQEIPRVRKDSGYPPLVTPTSQIVGTQAVFNVILGERYKMVTKEFKGLVHGDYGKTPAPISPEFTKQILGDEQPITCRPADLLEPEIEKLKAEASKYVMQEEDVLTYAMFPQVAPKFFEKRNNKLAGVDGDHVDFEGKSHPVGTAYTAPFPYRRRCFRGLLPLHGRALRSTEEKQRENLQKMAKSSNIDISIIMGKEGLFYGAEHDRLRARRAGAKRARYHSRDQKRELPIF